MAINRSPQKAQIRSLLRDHISKLLGDIEVTNVECEANMTPPEPSNDSVRLNTDIIGLAKKLVTWRKMRNKETGRLKRGSMKRLNKLLTEKGIHLSASQLHSLGIKLR
jgi:hypothetical protein